MAREPAAIRYKNPGAMWPGPTATKWGSKRWIYLNDGTGQGGNGKGNKIAIFDNWIDGICAQLDLWRTSKNYKNKTLYNALKVWSGGNHVNAYVTYVCKRIPGMTAMTVMNDAFWRSPKGALFLKVQAMHEAGKAMPVADDLWTRAQARVFAGKIPEAVVKPTVSVGTGATATATAVEGGFPLWAAVLIGVGIAVAIFAIWWFKNRPAAVTAPVIPEHLPAVEVPLVDDDGGIKA